MSPLKRNISIGFIIAFMVLLSIGSYSCKEKHDETAEDISAMSNEQLIAQKAELESLSIEKDKLMSELLASTTIINEIYTALEEVKGVPEGDQRTQILSKIHFLSDSLKSSHSKIKKSSKTIQGLQKEAIAFADKIAELEQTMTSMQELISTKESEIVQLREESGILRKDRDSYKASAENEAGERSRIETEKNTYYYIVGKEKQLEEKGIIVEEGSGFLGIGGTFVPARNLNEQDFQKVDARTIRTLPVPEKFHIVSSHNTKLLERVPNGMYISDPARFWTSKFLIIIDKR